MPVSGRYLRTRATQLITDRIRIFQNERLDTSDQTQLNEYTRPVTFKDEQNPQMEYNWVIRLPDIFTNGANVETPSSYNDPNFTMVPEQIEHRIDSVTAPYNNFEAEKNTDGTSFSYTAKHGDIGQLILVVDEYEDGATVSYFTEWQRKIRNNDGSHNPPAFYKENVLLYDIDSIKLSTNSTIYQGIWPVSIEPTGRNQQGNGKIQYTITLSVDSVMHLRIPPQQVLERLNNAQRQLIEDSIDHNGLATNAPDFLVDTLDTIVGIKDLIF